MSNFEELYKNTQKPFERQIERRNELLENQRENRQHAQDSHRQILEHFRTFQRKHQELDRRKFSEHRDVFFKNRLQLSEWMTEPPDDLEDWLLVPCPKGIRTLIIAENGRTEAIEKSGRLLLSFQSQLPGGHRQQHNQLTIIDAFYDKQNGCFWAIDLLAYSNQNFINCECAFRFFWLASKVTEDCLNAKSSSNPFPIRSIPHIPFTDPVGIDACLSKYPMFEENSPALDGLLFYHKDSHYVHGQTPLVLWLFPFMVEDVLGIKSVNENYLKDRPDNYQDYKTYIDDFNVKQRQKLERRSHKKKNTKVEEMNVNESSEAIEEPDDPQKVDHEMFLLETEG